MKKTISYSIKILILITFIGVMNKYKFINVYAIESGEYDFSWYYNKYNCTEEYRSASWKLEGDLLTISAGAIFHHPTNEQGENLEEIIGIDIIRKASTIRLNTGWHIKGSIFENIYPNVKHVELINQDGYDIGIEDNCFDCFPNVEKITMGNNLEIIHCYEYPFSKLNKLKEIHINGKYFDVLKELKIENYKGIISYEEGYYGWSNVISSIKKGLLYKKEGAKSLKDADIDLKKCFYTYDGSAKTPTVKVKLGDKILVRDKDYTLEYENNYDDGIATIYIVGQHDYWDIVEMNYVILPYNPGMEAVYDDGAFIEGRFVYGITDEEDNEVEVYCPAKSGIKTADIPDTVKYDGVEYKVTSIGNKAFYRNRKLQSVEIGDNIESIENYAFYGCTKLADVKLGSNVEEIGASAFRKCTKLKSIVLPKSVSELGNNVFFGCKRLKNITIKSKKVIDIKKNAIKGISSKATIKVNSKKLVKAYSKKLTKKTGYKKTMTIKKK